MNKRLKLALNDIIAGILAWRIWLLLSWQDIRLRYRRSQIGPFWITISMAITIYSMGFLYGKLFKMDLAYYFPFLATGLLTWNLLLNIVNDSTISLFEGGNFLKQMKLPFIIFTLKIVSRNAIVFFHNILAVIPILIFSHTNFGWHTLLALLGLIIILLNGIVYGLLLGMIGARFRDIVQIITSLMQVIFFVTPVMWAPKVLPEKYMFIASYNPFTHFLELIRTPLMGGIPSCVNYIVTLGVFVVGLLLMLLVFTRSRHRIIYWL